MQNVEVGTPTAIPVSSVARQHERDFCAHDMCFSRKKHLEGAKRVPKSRFSKQ